MSSRSGSDRGAAPPKMVVRRRGGAPSLGLGAPPLADVIEVDQLTDRIRYFTSHFQKFQNIVGASEMLLTF
ncbi:hypothetical protein GCM10027344_24510 [Spelaeicoccus albus]|uniref:Uncharacterized protein n=1 Tax=Spelaeicoccus albus TaxID=1280376 RepID=A0A7Z0D3C2_9MICO|nr:hypothetical protein [Spelaeicoccus albus]